MGVKIRGAIVQRSDCPGVIVLRAIVRGFLSCSLWEHSEADDNRQTGMQVDIYRQIYKDTQIKDRQTQTDRCLHMK